MIFWDKLIILITIINYLLHVNEYLTKPEGIKLKKNNLKQWNVIENKIVILKWFEKIKYFRIIMTNKR